MVSLHEFLDVSNSTTTAVPFTLVLYDYGMDMGCSPCDPEIDQIG